MKKQNKTLLYVLIIIIFFQSCSAKLIQGNNINSFTKDSLVIGYENNQDSTRTLITRENSNTVILSFYENFDDSVVLYLNGTEKWRTPIYAKNNPTESSGYSGVDIGVRSEKKDNVIKLVLLNQKRFIEFPLNKDYPMCTIQRYNNVWYINYTKYIMKLK